jgi:hypothetical protein
VSNGKRLYENSGSAVLFAANELLTFMLNCYTVRERLVLLWEGAVGDRYIVLPSRSRK